MPRNDLEHLRVHRIGTLNKVANEHFREALSHFFRRYAYNEWYPLRRTSYKLTQPTAKSPCAKLGWLKFFKRRESRLSGNALRDVLFDAVETGDKEGFDRTCRGNRLRILSEFKAWLKAQEPDTLRADPKALARYGEGLIAVAEWFARNGAPQLQVAIEGQGRDNPILRWRDRFSEADRLKAQGRFSEAIEILDDLAKDMSKCRGSAVERHLVQIAPTAATSPSAWTGRAAGAANRSWLSGPSPYATRTLSQRLGGAPLVTRLRSTASHGSVMCLTLLLSFGFRKGSAIASGQRSIVPASKAFPGPSGQSTQIKRIPIRLAAVASTSTASESTRPSRLSDGESEWLPIPAWRTRWE